MMSLERRGSAQILWLSKKQSNPEGLVVDTAQIASLAQELTPNSLRFLQRGLDESQGYPENTVSLAPACCCQLRGQLPMELGTVIEVYAVNPSTRHPEACSFHGLEGTSFGRFPIWVSQCEMGVSNCMRQNSSSCTSRRDLCVWEFALLRNRRTEILYQENLSIVDLQAN